jgi:hypothetical protein
MTTNYTSYSSPPPQAATFPADGETYQFGTPFATYASAPKRTRMRNIWIFLLILGEVAVFMGIFSPYFEDVDVKIGATIVGMIVAVTSLLLLEAWWRYRQIRVLLFDKGFTQDIDNKRSDVPWSEVGTVWQNVTKHYTNGVYTGTTHIYTILTTSGKRFIWNDKIKNVEQLGGTMQSAVTKIRLPEVFAAYQSGQTISFGKLAVNLTGLSKGNQVVPWSEIKAVEIQKGYIRVKKQDSWFNFANVPTSSIPNLFIFLSLVDKIIGINTGKK